MISPLRKLQIIQALRLTILFMVIFYGCDHITQWRGVSSNFSTIEELKIPYVESAFIIYYSVFLLPLLVFISLKDQAESLLLERKLSSAIIIAGITFLIFPATNQFHQLNIDRTPLIVDITLLIAGKYNMMPSLHVLLSYILYQTISVKLSFIFRAMVTIWLVLLMLSTLLTHQHHVIDVVLGIMIGIIIDRIWSKQRAVIS